MDELMFLAFDCVQDCGGADILRILKFVFKLIDLVLFIVPIGLIVMIMLDFAKNVIAAKEDEMKKNASIVVKRLIYCMVIFLVPTIVNFAIGLVSETGDNIAAKASYCIDYAKNEDLSVCEVDYGTLEKEIYNCYVCDPSNGGESIYTWDKEKPANDYNGCGSEYRVDFTKTTKNTCKLMPQCFKCSTNDNILVWSITKPQDGTNGCDDGFSTMFGLDSEERCSASNAKQCYQCKNMTGYVLSFVNPGRDYPYGSDSFNVSSGYTHCTPGFNLVDRSYCTTNPYGKCYQCSTNENIWIWSAGNARPSSGTNGCTSGDFNIIDGINNKEGCDADKYKTCYACDDFSGYVLSSGVPGNNYPYTSKNSFNVKSGYTHCVPGFTAVDKSHCTTNRYIEGSSHSGSGSFSSIDNEMNMLQ